MRLRSLDILRCLAVVMVILSHLPPEALVNAGWAEPAFRMLHDVGWVGVDLFFVLSGFLIGGLLMHEFKTRGKIRLGRFYFRRALRLYPAFYVLVIASVFLNPVFGLPAWRGAIIAEVLFLQNYVPGMWWHTWSLAVEEHFYITLPLVLAAMIGVSRFFKRADPFAYLVPVAVGVMGVALGLRIVTAFAVDGYSFRQQHWPTHLRMDGLALGVLLAYGYHFQGVVFFGLARQYREMLTLTAVVLILPVFYLRYDHPIMYTIGFSTLSLGFGLVVMLAVTGTTHRAVTVTGTEHRGDTATRRPLRDGAAAIGRHSYSIYLWHAPVQFWLLPTLGGYLGLQNPTENFWFVLATCVIGSVIGGIIMARLIEMPVLAMRDRYFPSETTPMGKTSAARPSSGTPSVIAKLESDPDSDSGSDSGSGSDSDSDSDAQTVPARNAA